MMAQFGMSKEHKEAFKKNRVQLVKDLIIDAHFEAVLIEHKILSDRQKQDIDVSLYTLNFYVMFYMQFVKIPLWEQKYKFGKLGLISVATLATTTIF